MDNHSAYTTVVEALKEENSVIFNTIKVLLAEFNLNRSPQPPI